MDGMQSIYWTLKEVMAFLRRSRAQVDRYRLLPSFPQPIVLAGAGSGALLFPKHDIIEWANSRPRRAPRPPADDSR